MRWAVVGILLGMAVLGTGWSSINMALASIQADLSASVLQLQWMMNAYGICICIPLLTVGKLGDAHGRKRYYLGGLVGLAVACLGAGLATSPEWLIGCMALFGLSAAAVLTLSQALIVHQYSEREKGKAVALWATFASISLAAGPIVGGAIIRYLSWRWVFFIDVPAAIGAIALVAFFVEKEKTHSAHCDWRGVGLLALIVGATVAGIMQGPDWGWSSVGVIGLFLVALVALLLFIFVEKRSREPLFRPDLFSNAGFLVAAICNGCIIGFIWSIFFFVPLYLQNEMGNTPLETGMTMLLITVPVALFSMPVGKLYERIGGKPLLAAGYLLLALSVFLQPYISIQISCLLMGLGWVLTWGPSTSKALSSLPHHMAGIASGMFMTIQEIGGVVCLAISGVFFRMGNNRFLAPHMDEIESAIGDRMGLLSDPKAAAEIVGKNSSIFEWLQDGFVAGYNDMLWFLVALMLIAFGLSLTLAKGSADRDRSRRGEGGR